MDGERFLDPCHEGHDDVAIEERLLVTPQETHQIRTLLCVSWYWHREPSHQFNCTDQQQHERQNETTVTCERIPSAVNNPKQRAGQRQDTRPNQVGK